jgi:transcriptional antiterminator NusG
MADKKWYVVRALSGKEKKVKELLENEIVKMGLSDAIPQVIIPTEKYYQVRKGRPVHKERNLFPGYVLIFTELNSVTKTFIKGIPGVLGFLGEKQGKIDPLREEEVLKILGKIDEIAEADEELHEIFLVGEHVKIIDGAFNGLNGIIEEVYDDKKKLKVMVKIFERKVPVELKIMQVEKE